MPTLTVFADLADDTVESDNGTPTQVRAGINLALINSGSMFVGYEIFTSVYTAYETFLSFDTSSLGAAAVVTAATLSVYGVNNFSTTDFTAEARLSDWGTSVTTADWVAGDSLGALPLLATFNTTGYATSAYNAFTSVALAENINKVGSTRLLLNSDNHRTGAVVPTTDSTIEIMATEGGLGTTNDPKLVVVYSGTGLLTPRIPGLGESAGEGSSGTDATSYVTNSIDFQPDTLYLLFVENCKTLSNPDAATVTGGGLTWVQIDSGLFASKHRATVYRAMASGATSGALTIDFAGNTQLSCFWTVYEIVNANPLGTNGSAAVVQSKNGNGTSNNPAITLDTTPKATSVVCVGAVHNTTTQTLTAGTNYTLLGTQVTQSTPSAKNIHEYDMLSATTAVGYAASGAGDFAIVAVEIQPAPPPVARSIIPARAVAIPRARASVT